MIEIRKVVLNTEENTSRAAQHENISNEWYTPPHILQAARDILGERFFDPCITEERYKQVSETMDNEIVPYDYITPEQDGTNLRYWLAHKPSRIWMNPPFEYAKAFLTTASQYVREHRNDALILTLLPANTSTQWWQKYIKNIGVKSMVFLNGRLKFINQSGKAVGGNTTGSVLFFIGENYDAEARLRDFSLKNDHLYTRLEYNQSLKR